MDNSRVEDILRAIINGTDISSLPPPQSRNEALLTLLGYNVDELKSAVEQISQTGIDASDASSGQVPVADGEGSWDWGGAGVSEMQTRLMQTAGPLGIAQAW